MTPNSATPQPRNAPHEPRNADQRTPQTNPAIPPLLRRDWGDDCGDSICTGAVREAFAGFGAR
jgi:hypothetical protein